MTTSNFLTAEEVTAIHDDLIIRFGGPHGLRDKAALESAVLRPRTGYYDGAIDQAAALMESLTMNHPFLDGNKRVGFFAAATLLRLNGLRIECDSRETHRHLMRLFDDHTFRRTHLRAWLEEHVVPLELQLPRSETKDPGGD